MRLNSDSLTAYREDALTTELNSKMEVEPHRTSNHPLHKTIHCITGGTYRNIRLERASPHCVNGVRTGVPPGVHYAVGSLNEKVRVKST